MIENYFKRPHAIRRVRSACTGPHMDAFASALSAWGYSRSRGQELLSGVALLGQWMDDEGLELASLDRSVLLSFVAEVRMLSSGDDRPEYCLGHASTKTTELYLRADPAEKLEMLELVVPPSLRKGTFSPPDQLLAMLQRR
jgi:hypothetical protein